MGVKVWVVLLLTAVVVFVCGFIVGRAHWKYKFDSLVAEYAAERSIAEARVETTRLQWKADMERAIADAEKKGKENEKAAIVARTELDRLRKLLNSSGGGVSGTTGDAGDIDPAATRAVLAECSERYAEVAEVADGHAKDVSMLMSAWPGRRVNDSGKDN